jgi:His/Glu/Gln/Arg/opine family amino acid ABC transporter permease subunit
MAKDNDKIEHIFVDANSVGVEMLLNDKADAFLIDDIVGEVYLKIHKNVLEKADAICDLEDGFSIAFPKNSAYFKTINEALKKINQNGTVKKIIKTWEKRYKEDLLKEEHSKRYKQSLMFIVKGSLLTIQYALTSIVFGMILAIFISLLMYSGNKFLYFFAKAYISVIRGTPLLLQLSLIYFGLSSLFGLNL